MLELWKIILQIEQYQTIFFIILKQKQLAIILLALICLQPAYGCLPCLQPLFSPLKSCHQPTPKPQPQPKPQPSPPTCYQTQPILNLQRQPPIFYPQPFPANPIYPRDPFPQPIPRPYGQSNTFNLSLKWACRQGFSFGSCQGSIVWNNQAVHSIRPCEYQINTASIQVNAVVGQNILQLRGEGISDTFGLNVDNVKLVRQGTSRNIVVNGGFEQPCTQGGWKYFNNIPGWKGDEIEIGAGKIYNSNWNSQVCELDGSRNDVFSQYFQFDHEYNQQEGKRSECGCSNGCGNQCGCSCNC